MLRLKGEFGSAYKELTDQIKMIEESWEKGKGYDEALREAKKSLEMLLFRYVSNGCSDKPGILGNFQELVSQYDPESYDLLDRKIGFLSNVIEAGPECNVSEITGFANILENKAEKGKGLLVFD